MEFNYKIEAWEYKLLESFYENPEHHFYSLIQSTIKDHKNACLDNYINYCKNNDIPISYNSDSDLIQKMYDLKLLNNVKDLNKKFLEDH